MNGLFGFLLNFFTFDGADGSRTGLVFRLFENFFRLRLSAANAPNPFEIMMVMKEKQTYTEC